MFARDPRHLQFEADINRLFLYTSYYRLGENADEKDAEEIIDMASKASVDQQQKQVQENIHYQFRQICQVMDNFLCPDATNDPSKDPSEEDHHSRRSGLSFAVGGVGSANKQAVPATKPLTRAELSKKFKDQLGYTLDIRQSGIPHKEAGQAPNFDADAAAPNLDAADPVADGAALDLVVAAEAPPPLPVSPYAATPPPPMPPPPRRPRRLSMSLPTSMPLPLLSPLLSSVVPPCSSSAPSVAPPTPRLQLCSPPRGSSLSMAPPTLHCLDAKQERRHGA
ncbi:hypothetical protein PR202_ga02087 [Eleusine coracana subsp. coracana]|uniref:Uncharacterized protein n=1 Tax=Eleusine coracana subsp. coracana TaxID=191504 RepID=A0AAV5BGS0_ELECO|nr:hypothetical protein PR202_ga01400 [Eleusine coracana subsp. coracana]GJM86246.1 hypothetical protein PR202_ga02087 [Eleusine coracana subsp. coracana]